MADAKGAAQAEGMRRGPRKVRSGPELASARRTYRETFWLYLHNQGWSIERIAGSEGFHRTTVARAIERLKAVGMNLGGPS